MNELSDELPDYHLCDISEYVEFVKGIQTNSESPTDNWIIIFKNGVTSKKKPIKYGFLKLFIDPTSIQPKKLSNFFEMLKGLDYEIDVYKDIIQPMVDKQICPNFVSYIGSGKQCSYDNLLNMLIDRLTDGKKIGNEFLFNENLVKNNLNRNISFIKPKISHQTSKPPSISDISLKRYNVPDKKFRYNFLLIEYALGAVTFKDWLSMKYSATDFIIEFWNITFQLSAACYAMSLSNMMHNDLHANNAFIQSLGQLTYYKYIINDIPMIIKTKYKVLIYDFDRSYVFSLGKNKNLNENLCKNHSQCNTIVKNRDMVKVMCIAWHMQDYIKTNILELFTSITPIQNAIELSYTRCDLQYRPETALPDVVYEVLHTPVDIMVKIYNEHLPKYTSEYIPPDNIYTCNPRLFHSNGKLKRSTDGIFTVDLKTVKIKIDI